MNKYKRIFNFTLIILLMTLSTNVYALDYIKSINIPCTETEAYKSWKNLPDEERKDAVIPVRCEEALNVGRSRSVSLGAITDNTTNLSKFNLYDENRVTPVKSQKFKNGEDSARCWTFSSMAAAESAYLMEGGSSLDFSEAHLFYNALPELSDGTTNKFGYYGQSLQNPGGNNFFSGAYFAQRRGPVLEEKSPFEASRTNASTKENTFNIPPDYIIKNIHYYMPKADTVTPCGSTRTGETSLATSCGSANVISDIKKMLVKYGAISTATTGVIVRNANGTINSSMYACTEYGPGHAVTIVGWDDTYSRNNFQSYANQAPILDTSGNTVGTYKINLPAKDGAWIIKDTYPGTVENSSLGTGLHYISYYDNMICGDMLPIMTVSDISKNSTNYNLYTYDYQGWDYALYYDSDNANKNTLYFKQKYNKKSNKSELLDSINILGINGDKVEIYYNKVDNFQTATKIGGGTFDDFSFEYKTFDVTKTSITSSNFYIYVKYTATSKSQLSNGVYDYAFPMYTVAEKDSALSPWYRTITSADKGVSYYSFNPANGWIDTTSNSSEIVFPSIYTFTTNLDYGISSSNPEPSISKVSTKKGYYYIPLTLDNVTLDDIKVKIYDKDNNNVTEEFDVEIFNNGFKISSVNSSSGDYKVEFTYKESSSSENFTIYGGNEILANAISIVTEENEVSVNGTLELTAVIDPENASTSKVNWSSDDESIAKVNSNGVVTGVSEGIVTIYAKTTDGTNLSDSKMIVVVDIDKEEGNGTTTPINMDDTPGIILEPTPEDSSGVSNPNTGNTILIILVIVMIVAIVFGKYFYRNQKGEI